MCIILSGQFIGIRCSDWDDDMSPCVLFIWWSLTDGSLLLSLWIGLASVMPSDGCEGRVHVVLRHVLNEAVILWWFQFMLRRRSFSFRGYNLKCNDRDRSSTVSIDGALRTMAWALLPEVKVCRGHGGWRRDCLSSFLALVLLLTDKWKYIKGLALPLLDCSHHKTDESMLRAWCSEGGIASLQSFGATCATHTRRPTIS